MINLILGFIFFIIFTITTMILILLPFIISIRLIKSFQYKKITLSIKKEIPLLSDRVLVEKYIFAKVKFLNNRNMNLSFIGNQGYMLFWNFTAWFTKKYIHDYFYAFPHHYKLYEQEIIKRNISFR